MLELAQEIGREMDADGQKAKEVVEDYLVWRELVELDIANRKWKREMAEEDVDTPPRRAKKLTGRKRGERRRGKMLQILKTKKGAGPVRTKALTMTADEAADQGCGEGGVQHLPGHANKHEQ